MRRNSSKLSPTLGSSHNSTRSENRSLPTGDAEEPLFKGPLPIEDGGGGGGAGIAQSPEGNIRGETNPS
jgi:hypothetical protein